MALISCRCLIWDSLVPRIINLKNLVLFVCLHDCLFFFKKKIPRLRYSVIAPENKLSHHACNLFLTTFPTQYLDLPLLPWAVYILEAHIFESWMNHKDQSI